MKLGIRELIFFVVMIGLVVACGSLFNKSRVKRDWYLADTASKKKVLVDLKASTGAGGVDWNQKIAELKQAITFFESKLPQEKEIDKILKDISQMAEANTLQTKTVRPLRTERAANYSELPIEMSLSGNFNGFYVFLQQLEKMNRITRVTHMTLNKIQDRDGDMQAKITVSIFFEPDTGGSRVATTGN
jgi:type IV pilus assembly protein PilO